MALNLASIVRGIARSTVVILCGLSLVATLACGGGEEPAGTTGAAVDEPKGSREVTLPGAAEGEEPVRAVIANGELPDGYPDDLPVPDNAEPGRALIIPNQSGLVTFSSSQSRDDLFAFFKTELANQGWQVQSEESDVRALVSGTKGGRKANVTISSKDEGSEFAVTFEGS